MLFRLLTILVICVTVGTPVLNAGAATEGEAAPPELCTLPPRTIDEIVALAEVEPPDQSADTPIPDPFKLPKGDEPDSKTRTEIKKDLRRAIACLNTGSLLSALSTFTDEYVERWIALNGGFVSDELRSALQGTEERKEKEYVRVIDYQDMVVLGDDRVLAIVYGEDPRAGGGPTYTAFYMKEVESGRWLIDEMVPISLGTPVAG